MATYGRMLDKRKKPTETAVEQYIGEEATQRLTALESFLGAQYSLTREMRFPFGNTYGWGYKYSHGRKHLCYLFFEDGAFTVTLQIGGESVPQMEALLPELQPDTQKIWENRYPCGDAGGGWVHIRVLNDATLADVEKLITAKVKPPRKAAP